jgi:hypothetical protein
MCSAAPANVAIIGAEYPAPGVSHFSSRDAGVAAARGPAQLLGRRAQAAAGDPRPGVLSWVTVFCVHAAASWLGAELVARR